MKYFISLQIQNYGKFTIADTDNKQYALTMKILLKQMLSANLLRADITDITVEI